jgi:preprotein translocase subunit Sec63
LILRAGPLKILYIINLILPILPLFKNFMVQNEDINVKRGMNELSDREAREILGVHEGATKDEVKAAYKRLILKNHPDHGGSQYIAEKLNKAKDVLLK